MNRIDTLGPDLERAVGQHKVRVGHFLHGIHAAAAVETVDAAAAGQNIVAGPAPEQVVASVSIEPDAAQRECAGVQDVGTDAAGQRCVLNA